MTSTMDPQLRSFISVEPDSHFPIQNLPYGVFRTVEDSTPRIGSAIGTYVVDLALLEQRSLLKVPTPDGQPVFARSSLNRFMALGRDVWRDVRSAISHLLRSDVATLRDDRQLRAEALVAREQVELLLPVEIGDFTDFYSSRYHAENVGRMLRPQNPLMPNWLHLPVAYHGRSSSIVVSDTDVLRPQGQRMSAGATQPSFGPSRSVDFELEMGYLIGTGNALGDQIPTEQSLDHVFGLVLVNDWSARDIQKWEYQPLGPFLSKSFATSISPWVVTIEALQPFQTQGPPQDPTPVQYLQTEGNPTFDVQLDVWLQTRAMAQAQCVCSSNLRHIYWNIRQQIAHHTANGCNLRPGDLLATGTVSGPTSDSLGCLLELSLGGRQPIELPNGETRQFLEDGDRVIMTGWCQGDGYRVGFGQLTGQLLPARLSPTQ